jgi:hypothetical protein
LLTTGCAEARQDFQDRRYLVTPKDSRSESIWMDRYNEAARTAEKQERERRDQERAAKDQRIAKVVAREAAARRSAWPTLSPPDVPPVQDPAVFAAFEALRLRAEAEAKIDEGAERRPSWAPPLLLGEELALACLELGYLTGDDKWIARLRAEFSTPRRSGQWLRRHRSTLPLEGIQCRGFSLWAGASRGPQSNLLFEAQREQSGTWRFGPRDFAPSYYPNPHHRESEWERHVRAREALRSEREHWEKGGQIIEGRLRQIADGIAEHTDRIAAIDAEDANKADAYYTQRELRQRALTLARARVLDFIGAPDAQMQIAARLWGHCCICGKALTDPLSLERGIGPDCFARRVDLIHRCAKEGRPPEIIALISGMPVEFVATLLSEERAR